MDEWISEYIRHDKNITNEYPNKFAHGKIKEYFCEWIYLSKTFECIWISDYFPKIILDYFGHFHMLCYFVPILNHFGPIIKKNLTIFGKQWKFKYIHYHRYWTNEYQNILVSINRWRMNIQIYSPWKKFTNIWTNEYIRLNIFEYPNIRPTLVLSSCPSHFTLYTINYTLHLWYIRSNRSNWSNPSNPSDWSYPSNLSYWSNPSNPSNWS